jgi:uncharacterized protein (TIGR01777 family)
MNILVTGSTGLIGAALLPQLAGHTVTRYNRFAPPSLEGFDAVVHLAGESIAGRWTAAKKERIRASRRDGTRTLCEGLARCAKKPRVLLCASAIGIYGDRQDEKLTEDSPPGTGFLADVVREWESATLPATETGMRVVNLRFGVVLSAQGGALKQMLPAFRFGAGGIIGSGRQCWSWVALPDVVAAIQHALTTDSLRGPVNVVAPFPVMNRAFTRTLGRVLHRPTIVPVPAWAVKLMLGEMGEALLLASTRVEPRRLLASGFKFQLPELEEALQRLV